MFIYNENNYIKTNLINVLAYTRSFQINYGNNVGLQIYIYLTVKNQAIRVSIHLICLRSEA